MGYKKQCSLGHTKLISCSTEHQGNRNEVGLVGRKENK